MQRTHNNLEIRHNISETRLLGHCCSPVTSQLTALHPSILPASHLPGHMGAGSESAGGMSFSQVSIAQEPSLVYHKIRRL